MSSSIYSTLDTQPDPQFRLLKIEQADTADSLICCTLHTTYLASAPVYDALSYAWGDGPSLWSIELQGQSWPVRYRLFQALTGLRSLERSEYIWIDALCINQSDLAERRDQVAIMGRIYSQATSVRVWLDSTEYVAPFLDQLIRLGEGQGVQNFVEDWLSTMDDWRPYTPDQDTWTSVGTTQSLVEFTISPYWPRMWVLQEVVLGRSVTLHWASRRISLDHLLNAHRNIMAELDTRIVRDCSDETEAAVWTASASLGYLTSAITKIKRISDLRQWLLTQEDVAPDDKTYLVLVEMLACCRTSDATDKRDRLYALFGLLPSTVVSQFEPLYSQSFYETWILAMSLILHKSNSLFLFSQINDGGTSRLPLEDINSESIDLEVSTAKDLPTWATDWFSEKLQGSTQSVADDLDFRIARETIFPKYIDDRYPSGHLIHVDQNRVLHLSGIKLDEVDERLPCSFPFKSADTPISAVVEISESHMTWELTHSHRASHDKQDVRFVRTLISDCIPTADSSRLFRRATDDDIDTLGLWFLSVLMAETNPEEKIDVLDPVLLNHMTMNLCGKSVFITREWGLLGLTYATPQEGDFIFLLAGGTHPVLLRPSPKEDESDHQYWTVVGECFGIFPTPDDLARFGSIWEDVDII
ncbi:MAG: hypothetical protein Q9168_004143 [Polycauliona sp. 1 TL-2023]